MLSSSVLYPGWVTAIGIRLSTVLTLEVGKEVFNLAGTVALISF